MSKLGLHLLIHDFQTGNTVRSDTESINIATASAGRMSHISQ